MINHYLWPLLVTTTVIETVIYRYQPCSCSSFMVTNHDRAIKHYSATITLTAFKHHFFPFNHHSTTIYPLPNHYLTTIPP